MTTPTTVTNQSKQDVWIDEKGTRVPVKYISKSDKLKEMNANKVLIKAMKLNEDLAQFKTELTVICSKVYDEAMKHLAIDGKNGRVFNNKGNFTWYNFDRSIKIEVSINERIDFDSIAINAAKEQLDAYIGEQLSDKQVFIRELVTDAFSTTRGKLDAKKVMSLLKYRSKIKAEKFQTALNLIEKSITRPSSKQYMRISFLQSNGEYSNVDLNFSSL